jgi:AraC-like DNA-binding protein
MIYERLPVTGDEYFRAYELVRDFADYRVSSSAVIDFYVYLPDLDMVISPTGYFTTRSYFRSVRDRSRESYEGWLTRLSAISERRFLPDGYALVYGSTDQYVPAIELVVPLPARAYFSSTPQAWAVIQIDKAPFASQFDATIWEDQSIFLVADERANVICVSDPDVPVDALLAPYREGVPVPSTAQVDVQGEQYVAFTRPSKGTGISWTYAALIPGDLYANEFRALRRFTLGAFALCVLVGGVLIYLVASLRYKPIHDLLSMLEPGADGDVTLRSDEFDMIRASLSATLAEDRLLRQEASENQGIVLQRLMQQVLKGSVVEDEATDARLGRLGVDVAAPDRWLVGLEPDLTDRSRFPELVSQVEEAVSRWPERKVVVRDVDGVVCVFFAGEFNSKEQYLGPIHMVKRDIEERFDLSCAVGISRIHRKRDGLAVLLQEVRAALSYRLVLGESRAIHVDEVLESSQSYYYPIDDENRLINSVVSGSYEQASDILSRVFAANFTARRLSVEMARCLMFDLISTMIKALESISSTGAEAEFWSRTRPISRLTKCHSFEQLQSEIDVILNAACDHVAASRSSHAVQLCEEIETFIHEHLRDPNLGPDLIADALEKNSAYISRVFREEYGTGISQRIKALRVSEARRRLVETDRTVREIADELGFVDSNALIRAFKSTEGVTPGEYRESHRADIANPAPDATNVRK